MVHVASQFELQRPALRHVLEVPPLRFRGCAPTSQVSVCQPRRRQGLRRQHVENERAKQAGVILPHVITRSAN